MAGAGRAQPSGATSTESTVIVRRVAPSESRKCAISRALLSGRICHHADQTPPPAADASTHEFGHDVENSSAGRGDPS